MRNLKMMYECVSSRKSAVAVWKGAFDENHFLLPTADDKLIKSSGQFRRSYFIGLLTV